MADIDQILAGGAGSSSRADFSPLAGVADAYWKGKDDRAKNDLRDAFKDGLPMKGDQPDWGEISKTFFQKGAVDQGIAAANQGLAQQNLEAARQIGGLAFPVASATPVASAQPANTGPPSMNRPNGVADPAFRRGASASQPAPQAGSPLPPDQQQDPNSEVVRMPTAQAVADWRNSVPAPQQPPQVAQAAPQQPDFSARFNAARPGQATGDPTLGGLVPPGRTAEQQINLLNRAIGSGVLNPTQAKTYQAAVEAIRTAIQPTNEIKNATASGQTLPQYQQAESDRKVEEAGGIERAKENIKEQQDYITQGRAAQNRLGTLNTITNIINTDKNLTLGFGGETSLKIKMALEQAGLNFGDLSGAQAIQKLNGLLASESVKAVSPRPTQFEFKTFLSNNPGLALDEKGNIRMLGILAQNAKREVDLGKLARRNQDNWQNWDNVVEAYDKKFPIKDPTTGKVLSSHSIIAPGTSPASNTAETPKLEAGKTVVNGHTYIGGNPKQKSSWELRS